MFLLLETLHRKSSVVYGFYSIIDKVSKLCNNSDMNAAEKKRFAITAELFKAIGHPDRLAMLELLSAEPWCVCALASELKLNKSVASKHLSLLFDVGILEMEKKGTQVIYTLVAPCVVEMSKCSYLAVVQQRKKRL